MEPENGDPIIEVAGSGRGELGEEGGDVGEEGKANIAGYRRRIASLEDDVPRLAGVEAGSEAERREGLGLRLGLEGRRGLILHYTRYVASAIVHVEMG